MPTPITALPAAPSRAEGPVAFNAKADPFIAAMPPMVTQINLTVTWMNETIDVVALARTGAVQAADAASQSKIAAAQSAADALAYRNSAQAAAAAAGSAAGLPSLAGNARKPLTPTAALDGVLWATEISIPKYIDKVVTTTVNGTYQVNLVNSTVYDFTLSGNVVISLVGMPSLSGETITLVIRIRQAGTPKTITWFSGITWLTPAAVAPTTPSAGQIVEYVLSSTGTGSTWIGRVGAST